MATETKSTDDAVVELLVTVARKKAALAEVKKAKKPQWKTNLSLGRDPKNSHDRVNLQTRTDPNEIIAWYVFLSQKEQAVVQAAEELGLPTDLTWLGFPIADWKSDLKARAVQLSIDLKKKEIDELDKRVNKLVSPDQRREMELVALQELLKD